VQLCLADLKDLCPSRLSKTLKVRCALFVTFTFLSTSYISQIKYGIPCFLLTPKRLGKVCVVLVCVGLMMIDVTPRFPNNVNNTKIRVFNVKRNVTLHLKYK